MATKQTTLKCDINVKAQSITFKECKRGNDDQWEQVRGETFDYENLPSHVKEFVALYGLRALLADRTSDAKRLGVSKLSWMCNVYQQLLEGELHKKRAGGGKAGGVDLALVELVVRLKKVSAVEAEAALKVAGKEGQATIATKYADQLADIRKELADAETVDLGDLL